MRVDGLAHVTALSSLTSLHVWGGEEMHIRHRNALPTALTRLIGLQALHTDLELHIYDFKVARGLNLKGLGCGLGEAAGQQL